LKLKHELWEEDGRNLTFCLAGSRGDEARKSLEPTAKLIWTVEAHSPFEAMTAYYKHMGWGEYKSGREEIEKRPYTEEWREE
jgi:hypothetical protein